MLKSWSPFENWTNHTDSAWAWYRTVNRCDHGIVVHTQQLIPNTPCIAYLPTLGWFQGSMYANMPYMECLGMMDSFRCTGPSSILWSGPKEAMAWCRI